MNGIPFLDSVPVNWFILGVSVLAGVILFLILTQIPDEDEEKKDEEEEKTTIVKKPRKKKKSTSPRS